MTIKARIQLDTENIIGEIHDHLYGANLEHVGRSIYQGIWAEMLQARKFAEHDAMYVGVNEGLVHQNPNFGIASSTPLRPTPDTHEHLPWQAVNPDYHKVLFVHDNTTFYTGKQSQRITIREADGLPHGIQQSYLFLQTGHQYDLRLVIKGEGQAVEIRLEDQVWKIDSAPSDWTTMEHVFVPTETTSNGTISITSEAKGNLWIGCVSLMDSNNIKGFRADVIESMKDWSPTFLRWPGGNFASAYHWMGGIGDRDKRPSYLDPAWWLWETNDVGLHEFIDLCRIMDCEPVLTNNIGTGTVEETVSWLEYCNGDQNTKYGKLRAENGSPESFNVKTWFVGNEQFGNWQVGHCDAETYGRQYLEYSRAMRKVDPNLLLLAVGVPTDLYGHWNELVLKMAATEMEELSVHYYSIRTEKRETPPTREELFSAKLGSGHDVKRMLDETWDVVKKHSDPPVPIAFDEWNTYMGGKPPDFFEDYDMADAIYTGVLMNACIQRCDWIKMSAIFNLTNVMGNYRITTQTVWKTPTTLVLELLTNNRGKVGINCSIESPVFSTPEMGNQAAYDDVPTVDAAATFDQESGKVYLSITNSSVDSPAIISLDGISTTQDAQKFTVSGDHKMALNLEEDPEAVTIQNSLWQQGTELEVAPHSFTLVVIQT
jgi:alpha-N-arabinofuranosidase